jgi:phospholipid/cholesterol/gamma-HCH transport system permease protein
MTIFSEIGGYLLMIKGMFSKPENMKMYWKEFIHQCSDIGIGSLGIVIVISIFMGAVSTVQTAYQLVSPLIPKSAIAQIVRDTVILEFAPTLICIVLAGVVGSKIASELGKTYLVLPKILAALLVIPMLVVIAAVLGVWGGRLAGGAANIISESTFDKGLLEGFLPYNVVFALAKAYTFAFLISSVPAYFGYYVQGGSLEIGRASTKAVVTSCILILFADYILAALLL